MAPPRILVSTRLIFAQLDSEVYILSTPQSPPYPQTAMDNDKHNSKLVERFLNAFPTHAPALLTFVLQFDDVNRVPPGELWKGMNDILEIGYARAPRLELECKATPEPAGRGPTPFFVNRSAASTKPGSTSTQHVRMTFCASGFILI